MNVLRQLQGFFWEKRSYLFLSILCLAIATGLGLVYPYLLQVLIDDAIKQQNFGIVPQLALTVLGVVILKASMQFLHGFFGGRLGNFLAYKLRNACYEKLQFLSFRYYDTARTGDLMSRLTGDLEAIRMFIGFGFAQLLNMLLMVTFGAIMMLTISWQLTLVTLVAMPFLVVAALKFESKIHPAFQEMRLALSSLTTAVRRTSPGFVPLSPSPASRMRWRSFPVGTNATNRTKFLLPASGRVIFRLWSSLPTSAWSFCSWSAARWLLTSRLRSASWLPFSA